MDKIEARSKWLKANGKAPKHSGKHQRVILAWAKFKADDDNGIPRQQASWFVQKWLKVKAHEVPKHVINAWNRYLAHDPPSYDSGTLLSEADAKTMMDKIEARTKWLQANGKARKFQEADPECYLATFPECDEPVASDKKCPRAMTVEHPGRRLHGVKGPCPVSYTHLTLPTIE